MRTKLTGLLCACLTICMFVAAPAQPMHADKSDMDSFARVDGLYAKALSDRLEKSSAASVQQWIDSYLTDGAGTMSEWYVLALAENGEKYDFSGYSAALSDYVASKSKINAVTLQKYALVTALVGGDRQPYATVIDETVGSGGIMSLVYGLHLVDAGYPSELYTVKSLSDMLCERVLDDGGWAVSGNVSDVDVTAMALQALSHSTDDERVADVIENALELLSKRQLDSGGFMSYGIEAAESSAQVALALTALSIDPLADARFVKGGNDLLDAMSLFWLDDGGFSHQIGGEYSESATSQCFQALSAMRGFYASPDNDTDAQKPSDNVGEVTTSVPTTDKAPSTTDSSGGNAQIDRIPTYKIVGSVIIALAFAAVCLVFCLKGRKHASDYVIIALAAVLLASLLWLIDIKSPDKYNVPDAPQSDSVGNVSIVIECEDIASIAEPELIGDGGVILARREIALYQGDTVYDVLVRAARQHKIQFDNSSSAASAYIAGINNIYEGDYGELSGWIYFVNGESPSVGCAAYTLSDGDEIVWHYTMGRE